MSKQEKKKTKLFNSPTEIAIRALLILSAIPLEKMDFQRILYLDYLLVNSGDFVGGPASLHPCVPSRKSAVGIRRKDLADGMDLLVSRELIRKEFSSTSGVIYQATDLSNHFLKYLTGLHYSFLLERSKWLITHFKEANSAELAQIIGVNNGEWSAEFSSETSAVNDWYGDK